MNYKHIIPIVKHEPMDMEKWIQIRYAKQFIKNPNQMKFQTMPKQALSNLKKLATLITGGRLIIDGKKVTV